MKAIGFSTSLPITDEKSLFEFETQTPFPGPRDLLVRVRAVSVNPVDCKQRQRAAVDTVLDAPKILGYDASGVVETIGTGVTLFKPGDLVYYAGSIKRDGTNAEFHLVDERIAGHKPESLNDAEAAALPLTALTAWEVLFDRMRIPEGGDGGGKTTGKLSGKTTGKTLLIIGGAGGVGSMAIQLAEQLTGLHVIATASREETARWCRELGAEEIADHHDLAASVRNLGHQHVDSILCTNDFAHHWPAIAELIGPQGSIGSILGAPQLDVSLLMGKSVSLSWELMFTRSSFETDDMIEQHHILERVAGLVNDGRLRTTLSETFAGFTAANHRQAHRLVEAGRMIGKAVITY